MTFWYEDASDPRLQVPLIIGFLGLALESGLGKEHRCHSEGCRPIRAPRPQRGTDTCGICTRAIGGQTPMQRPWHSPWRDRRRARARASRKAA